MGWLALFAALGCGDGGSAAIEPLAPVTVRVNETMRVELEASGSGEFATAPFELPGARLTVTGTAAAGGELRWTPLASHVGSHVITVQLVDGGDVLDETDLMVTVEPSADSAPVFLRPGAGGTFDLTNDPVVAFDIEVRDDDSASVLIRENGELPEGAAIYDVDEKRARFEWQPTPDQVAASERWTIPLAADDGDHQPTELDYVAVLRGAAKPGCPGEAPVVTITSPTEAGREPNTGGYRVVAEVSDDMGLRDPPLLFFSTAAPDDPANPDVTAFEQLVMMPDGSSWSARVPSLGLGDGDEAQVYVLVSATDNDDPSGASCDHRTDSALRTFTAIGGGGAALDVCESCSSSADCAGGGICAAAGSGGRCVPGCSGDGACTVGGCGATVSVEGSVLAGCGPTEDVCGSGACVDDAREDDDNIANATVYGSAIGDGRICADDPDLFAIAVLAGERVTVTLDGFRNAEGDLDLQLLDEAGTILDSSASTADSETVEHCFAAGGTAYAKVIGYGGAENSYALRATVMDDAAMCCMDDTREENDTAATGASLSVTGGNASLTGMLCPSDPDWYRFSVSGPTRIVADMVIGSSGQDLDMELRGPTGTLIASSRGVTDTETIDARVNASGTYAIGVLGYLQDSSDYLLDVTLTAESGCTSDTECAITEVCSAGSCVDRSCTVGSSCPMGPCPTPGPGTASECGAPCSVNSDCRSGETCKWLPEGRFCAQRGSGGNGDACTDFTDCGGQRACVDWPGGTCARAGCSSNSDCETDTFCVAVDGQNVCARSCWDSDDVCRSSGYRCAVQDDRGGSIQLVCVPL
ncbi:MAG: hypothetical protein CMN30_12000 [Sandaracinus sp.]|nr:hypothetical protein [Sandaracinus sp.]